MSHGFWQSERGFTLAEVMATILIMGIVFAIASSYWFGVVESRRVDSATNQIVSELHFAHTSATNRLAPWQVVLEPDTANYQIGPTGGPLTPRSLVKEKVEEEEEYSPPVILTGEVAVVEFEANGEATRYDEDGIITGPGNIEIRSAAEDEAPCHEIEINDATSRIRVITNVC